MPTIKSFLTVTYYRLRQWTVEPIACLLYTSFNSRGFASCPFHNEKTPSLSIKKEHYKCFGCGAYGGIIDFVMNYFGLPFIQAVMKINSDFHLGLTKDKPDYRTRRQMAEEAKINAAYEKYRDELHQNYLTLCQVHAILFRRLCDGETWLEDITDRLRTLLETFDDGQIHLMPLY